MGAVAEGKKRRVYASRAAEPVGVYRMRGDRERRLVGRNLLTQVLGRAILDRMEPGRRPRQLDPLLSEVCLALRSARPWDGADRALLSRFEAEAILTPILAQSPSYQALLAEHPEVADPMLVRTALYSIYPL